MRRFVWGWLAVLLIGVEALDLNPVAEAQSYRTAPAPIRQAGRTRLFGRNRQDQKEAETPPAKTPSTIPGIPTPQLANNSGAIAVADPLTAKVNKAIDINSRRFLSPELGHTPWMILHGVLALRQDYRLRVNGQIVNGLQYVTGANPYYSGRIPNPLNPAVGLVPVQGYWFESTAYGGRAHPYQVMFAFEGHENQSLAILSTCNLPKNHPFVVHDSQRPGNTKTITMEDMLRHAQKTIKLGNPYELAWTLWFLSNYLEPEESWTDMHGQAWSMEQLLKTQINAPIVVSDPMRGPPCGGTHALFAMACACNSYEQKHQKLVGTWVAARNTLNYYIQAAQAGQNPDGSMSNGYFRKYKEMAPTYGDRLKTSGHMLEWLMMALPPEKLQEPWVLKGIERLADDLINGQNQPLDHEHTGSLFHSVHALVLYRNRVEPPEGSTPAERVVELPVEMRKPAPGGATAPEKTPMPGVLPKTPAPQLMPKTEKPEAAPQAPQAEATIKLLGPGPKRLSPQEAKPLLRPITNTREPEPLKPGDTPAAPPKGDSKTPESSERGPLLVPMPPELMKPVTTPNPTPAPGEPKSDGAVVKPLTEEEGAAEPAPLFGEPTSPSPAATKTPLAPAAAKTPPAPPMPMPMESQKPEPAKPPVPASGTNPADNKPAPSPEVEKPAGVPLTPPALPEPTPRKPPSAGD